MEHKGHLSLDGHVSMAVCTAGQRRVFVNGMPYTMRRAMVCISSPLVFITELERSADYREAVLSDRVDIIYEVVRQVFGTLWRIQLFRTPCLQLNEERFRFFVERAEAVRTRRERMQATDSPDERRLLEHIVHLLEQEAVLELIHTAYGMRLVDPEPVGPAATLAFNFAYSVTQHFRTQRPVAYYAAEAHLSPAHFSRIVRDNTGRKPSEWIAVITMLQAQCLLRQTDMSIKEIAAELCFPEQFTFRK